MFLLNSRLNLFTEAQNRKGKHLPSPSQAPLLPKLRGNFAEFLKEGSFVRLRSILLIYLCWIAVRTHIFLVRGFSCEHGISYFALRLPIASQSLNTSRDLPPDASYELGRRQPKPRLTYPSPPPHPDSGRYMVQEY